VKPAFWSAPPRAGTVFTALLADHRLPFLPALDPFRLSAAEIAERLAFLETLGGGATLLASTDDERYDAVLPGLAERLRLSGRTLILEHFRPSPGIGFRRACPSNAVMMTRVLSAGEEFFKDCRSVEPFGDVSAMPEALRLQHRLVFSGAIVFGPDDKSRRYVSARHVDEDDGRLLTGLLAQTRAAPLDVVYLFSRHARLAAATVARVRAAVGPDMPVIASGCIRSPEDVRELRGAGATIVVVGSLLEEADWRRSVERLAGLAAPGRAPLSSDRRAGNGPDRRSS
jgi:heptaprenylglyceryl phosphate synthase